MSIVAWQSLEWQCVVLERSDLLALLVNRRAVFREDRTRVLLLAAFCASRSQTRAQEQVKKRKVLINKNGTVEELRNMALRARKNGSRQRYWEYIGWFYQLYVVDGTYVTGYLDNHRLSTKNTSLEEFLESNYFI